MKKLLLQSVLLLIFFNSYSQESQTDDWCTPGTKTYKEKFDKIVGMYSAMLDSDKSAKYRSLKKELDEKSDYINAIGDETPKDINQSILDNISKTKFSDKAAAEDLMARVKAAKMQVIVENAEMYKMLQDAVIVCGNDFLEAVYLELILKYRDDFHL